MLAEPNWISLTWSDTGATSYSDGAPCVNPTLSSTKVQQTLGNLTLFRTKLKLPYQIDSDRRRSFAVLNSSVRLRTCTWVEWHLNRALMKCLCSSVWGLLSHFNDKSITNKYTIHVSHLPAIFHLFSTFECIFFRVHGLLFCGIFPTCFSRR